MKKLWKKRLLAVLIAVTAGLNSHSLPARAEEDDSTIAGAEETIEVSSGIAAARENDFNDDWKFYLGTSGSAQNPGFNDSGWEDVSLPHDFSISQAYTTAGEAESGFLPGGTGWYRKTFTLPENYQEKKLFLNFDGVYSDAYVYVNGTLLGEHHYGYSSFAFDITDEVVCDGNTENVVAVRVVNTIPSSRWYSGSGIYRDVTLIVTNGIHVEQYGTHVTTPDIEDGTGTVHIETEIVNDTLGTLNEENEETAVTVKNTVYTLNGEAVSDIDESEISIAGGEKATVEADVLVNSPKLWSTKEPNLYYVHTELWSEGIIKDSYDTTFGFRYFSFDGEYGFKLNGDNLKLNGVCLHADQGALGSAAYYDAMYRQLTIMKDMGVNAVRTSHNPHDRQFMEMCNELGILVIEDCFDMWGANKNGNTYDFSRYFNTALSSTNQVLGGDSTMTWGEFAMRSIVKRDRNDPCLIVWALANEVQEGTSAGATNAYVDAADMLLEVMNELDGTRPATLGDNTRGSNSILNQIYDHIMDSSQNPSGGVAGYNYASGTELDRLYNDRGVIISTETSSAVNSRSIYMSQANMGNADGKYHLTSYDTSAVSWGLTAHDSMYNTLTRDFVAGEFVWTGFDYLGEPTPWNGTWTGSVTGNGAVPNSSYFGIVETTGFPKDTYYLYRSQWNQNSNTLHLVTSWDEENMLTDGEKTPVVIYSNAPKVELYRNGELIGTAVRTVNTTEAGYEYYTYTVESLNSEICTAVDATGAESLYATFQVAYETGNISAKAYNENGGLITDTEGNAEVYTPGTASGLETYAERTEIAADGSSLTYISVDVTDEKGTLDTTAVNKIQFTLSGEGEITGVDNGDQATTEKYQQASVLKDSTSAQIAAYAGKALVIVRSTDVAGSFTLEASSEGLTGDSVTVSTVKEESSETQEGLVSYTMIRDYTIKAGTIPQLKNIAIGTMADGTEIEGRIVWEEINETIYNTPGDYMINGTLSFEGEAPLSVTCRLHVVGNIAALRNISTVTSVNTVPVLPDNVVGILKDGTLSGEFAVEWESMQADSFSKVGEIVTVNGTAEVFKGQTLPVTASVRVAEEVNTESQNAALAASRLSQDVPEEYWSDNLSSLNNGTTKPGDNTEERWSNWNNRYNSDSVILTFSWDTAQLLNNVNLYYYFDSCAALPKEVRFEYSLDGQTYVPVEVTAQPVEEYSLGAEYTYIFEEIINPVSLRIIVQQQGGVSGEHCVALTEAEIMTFAGEIETNSSAALSGITVDESSLSDFAPDTYNYEAEGSSVLAVSDSNAGITVLPVYENIVRILTISEDGSDMRIYEVKLNDSEIVVEKTVPEISLSVSAGNDGKIVLTGTFEDYQNLNNYYEVTSHGFVYYPSAKLGTKILTVNTAGRTRVNFSKYEEDGSFTYQMTPVYTSTRYTFRAFLEYTNEEGRTVYAYSAPQSISYNGLK